MYIVHRRGGELRSLGGVYSLVSCEDSYGCQKNDLSREEWLEFLKDIYEAKTLARIPLIGILLCVPWKIILFYL